MKAATAATLLATALLGGPALADHTPEHKTPLRRAHGMLVDAKGMTVYTFDNDSTGKSACTGQCAQNWPPVPAAEGTPPEPYGSITREDGTRQLTYKGKPVYTFVKDQKPGDKTGDKVKDVWHALTY